MDKLARYNQKLLAVLGTLALAALTVILLISVVIWIISITDNYGGVDNTLQVPDSLVQDNGKINQLVSFGAPELVDTLSNIYIIPVSQRTLEKPVKEDNMRLGKIGSYSSNYEYSYGREGSFNNIIVYRKNEDRKQPLFDFRINITRYYDRIVRDKIYLFIIGSKGDTNKDGAYSYDDLDNLYIYDPENDYLKTISMDNASYKDSDNLYETEEMVLQFGMDINRDGEFDLSREPIRLKRYSIAKDELTDFIPEEMRDQLQKIVD